MEVLFNTKVQKTAIGLRLPPTTVFFYSGKAVQGAEGRPDGCETDIGIHSGAACAATIITNNPDIGNSFRPGTVTNGMLGILVNTEGYAAFLSKSLHKSIKRSIAGGIKVDQGTIRLHLSPDKRCRLTALQLHRISPADRTFFRDTEGWRSLTNPYRNSS